MAFHVVSKRDNAVTATFPFDEPLPPLGPWSVRVKIDLVAITSNNLSYARNGTLLHWWELYPVPSSAPAPFNNNEEWGIVPAWGYGQVIESNITAIEVGSSLFGFWPTSSYPIDLKLEVWQAPGHWSEVSEHRRQNMTVYNRYIQVKGQPSDQDRGILAGVQTVWQCAYLLNAVTFPFRKDGIPIHPLGFGHEWSTQDADLSKAVVISLSAASKTARSLAWNFARNREFATNGPLGLLQATSNTVNLATLPDSSLKTHNSPYNDLTGPETLAWISNLKPSRFVIIDFGAADSVLRGLSTTLSEHFPNTKITNFAVGSESKVYTPEETKTSAASKEQLSKIQVNTSSLRDRAIEAEESAAKWFTDMEDAWSRCISEGGMGDIELLWRKGVSGANGIEGMWQDVCNGRVRGDQCLVVKVQE